MHSPSPGPVGQDAPEGGQDLRGPPPDAEVPVAAVAGGGAVLDARGPAHVVEPVDGNSQDAVSEVAVVGDGGDWN